VQSSARVGDKTQKKKCGQTQTETETKTQTNSKSKGGATQKHQTQTAPALRTRWQVGIKEEVTKKKKNKAQRTHKQNKQTDIWATQQQKQKPLLSGQEARVKHTNRAKHKQKTR